MEKFERTYWWHVGKKNLVAGMLEKLFPEKRAKILEVGSGAGEITSILKDYGEVFANDISEEALAYCQKKGISNLVHGDFNEVDLSSHKGTFDIVLALDVLEHIQDDTLTMSKAYSLLKPGGVFLVNVPAYKFLWSSHDEALQHKRRYTSYEIRTKLTEQGFSIEKHSFFVFFVFPVVALFKFLSNFIGKDAYPKTSYIMLPDQLNSFMVRLLNLEAKLMEYSSLPFGTTINLIARKPEE